MRRMLTTRQPSKGEEHTTHATHSTPTNLVSGDTLNRHWYYLGAALLLASILFHQPLLLIVGLLFLLVFALTDIWAHYCMQNLHYHRQLSEQRAIFGETITLSVQIDNAKLLPLPWLETQDSVPRDLPIQGQELRSAYGSNVLMLECLFSPSWYERVTRRYTVLCNMRGIHAFGPVTLRSGDIFGFLSREKKCPDRQYLLVYPLVVPLDSFNLPARHPFGNLRTPRRLLEDPSRVIGIRDYQYGDSMRRVDWKATARAMQLQSRVYEETTTHTLMIFLNATTRLDIHYGVHPELQELAICAAASVASWGLDQGYAVGLHANTMLFMPDEATTMHDEKNSDSTQPAETFEETLKSQLRRRHVRVAAASNAEQRSRIMEMLARIQSYFGSSIEDVIQQERTHLPAGATVVVITSAISETLIDLLTRIRRSGHTVSILFVGDTPPPLRLAQLAIHHLGGEEHWQALANAYRAAPAASDTTVGPTPVFHL